MKYAYLASLFAGLSTMLGSIVLFIKNKNSEELIGKSLAFASGVMIMVSIIDLIPNSIIGLNKYYHLFLSILLSSIFVIVGIILSMSLNKYIPSDTNKLDCRLYKTGIISMIAIVLHNIPEGIATFLTASSNMKLGISLSIAIALHNIPEGISISVPLYFSTNNKLKAIGYTFISGISEFFGAIIASIFLLNIKVDLFLYLLYPIIAGIMINLSFYELLPSSTRYISKMSSALYVLIGVLLMFIVHLIN